MLRRGLQPLQHVGLRVREHFFHSFSFSCIISESYLLWRLPSTLATSIREAVPLGEHEGGWDG